MCVFVFFFPIKDQSQIPSTSVGNCCCLQACIRAIGTAGCFKEELIPQHFSQRLFNVFSLLAEKQHSGYPYFLERRFSLDRSCTHERVPAQLIPNRGLGWKQREVVTVQCLSPDTCCVHSELDLNAGVLGRVEWFLLHLTYCSDLAVNRAACMVPLQSSAGTAWPKHPSSSPRFCLLGCVLRLSDACVKFRKCTFSSSGVVDDLGAGF